MHLRTAYMPLTIKPVHITQPHHTTFYHVQDCKKIIQYDFANCIIKINSFKSKTCFA